MRQFQKEIHQFSYTAIALFPQVIVCSATLHSFDVKKLSERIMHFPTWVDLKGEDSVPETVHHVVVPVNPKSDRVWERLGKNHIRVSLLLLWDMDAFRHSSKYNTFPSSTIVISNYGAKLIAVFTVSFWTDGRSPLKRQHQAWSQFFRSERI